MTTESDYIESLEQRVVDLEDSLNRQRESMIRLLDELDMHRSKSKIFDSGIKELVAEVQHQLDFDEESLKMANSRDEIEILKGRTSAFRYAMRFIKKFKGKFYE